MSDTKINDSAERLERAYIAGMDEEFRGDLRVVLDALSKPAELAEQHGDALVASLVQVMNAEYDGLGRLPADVLGVLNMAVEALAATGKQQVGEVQGDALTAQQVHDRFGFLEGLVNETTFRRIADEAFRIQQAALASPPAQGIDLGQFMDFIGFAIMQALALPETDPRRDYIRKGDELLALIDSHNN
jgi:hypothetical protein